VYKLPKKARKSSKSKEGKGKEDRKTCRDFTIKGSKEVEVLDIEGFRVYGSAFPYFFANVATKYYLNKSLESVDRDELQSVLEAFCTELSNLSDRRKLDEPPFLYPGNDSEFAHACLTPNVLCNVLRDSIRKREITAIKVYGTILPESGEHLKLMFPKLAELRRIENIAISPELLALAVIGAFISYTTKYNDEQHYVFVDLVQEFRLDLRSLNESARSLMLGLIKGKSSELVVRVGIASIVTDKAIRKVIRYDRALRELPGSLRTVFYHVITTVSTKVALKSFNQYDVTDLALDIARLDIANPLVRLVKLYPSEELQKSHNEARKLRRIIEATCKAIYTWHSTKGVGENLEELYSILRAFSTLSRGRDELEKLDEFITGNMKTSIKLSDILEVLSEKMRVWI
jgi:hypothetical protein